MDDKVALMRRQIGIEGQFHRMEKMIRQQIQQNGRDNGTEQGKRMGRQDGTGEEMTRVDATRQDNMLSICNHFRRVTLTLTVLTIIIHSLVTIHYVQSL